jgi:hypothetical protein
MGSIVYSLKIENDRVIFKRCINYSNLAFPLSEMKSTRVEGLLWPKSGSLFSGFSDLGFLEGGTQTGGAV